MATANLSFNTKGATPLSYFLPTSQNQSYNTTPFSKALGSMQNSTPAIPLQKSNSNENIILGGKQNVPTGQYSNTPQSILGNNPGLIPPAGQDVKSHTVTNVDGSTVSQTYHPSTPVVPNTAPKNDASGGYSSYNPNANLQQVTGGSPGIPQGQTTYPGLINSIAQKASSPSPEFTQAMQNAQNVNEQLAKSKMNLAGKLADNANNPIPLEFQQGRAQVLTNQGLAQQNALASEFSGASNLIGAANTQQQTQQSGLLGAAGLTPEALRYGGYGEGNSALNPLNNLQSIAQQVINGQISPSQAYAMGGGVSSWQGALNAELQKQQPGFDTSIAEGKYGAKSTTAGTQGQQVESYKSALQQGKNLQSQLSDLITTFGLNPNDINAANSGLQLIAKNTSSPQYKILKNYINDIANTYAQILTPSGGRQTDTTLEISQSMLDATANGKSILSVMQSLDQAAQAKIAGVPTLSGNTQSNGTSSNLYDF